MPQSPYQAGNICQATPLRRPVVVTQNLVGENKQIIKTVSLSNPKPATCLIRSIMETNIKRRVVTKFWINYLIYVCIDIKQAWTWQHTSFAAATFMIFADIRRTFFLWCFWTLETPHSELHLFNPCRTTQVKFRLKTWPEVSFTGFWSMCHYWEPKALCTNEQNNGKSFRPIKVSKILIIRLYRQLQECFLVLKLRIQLTQYSRVTSHTSLRKWTNIHVKCLVYNCDNMMSHWSANAKLGPVLHLVYYSTQGICLIPDRFSVFATEQLRILCSRSVSDFQKSHICSKHLKSHRLLNPGALCTLLYQSIQV